MSAAAEYASNRVFDGTRPVPPERAKRIVNKMNKQPIFVAGWNAALESAATAEGKRGFRVTAGRLREQKLPEAAKAAVATTGVCGGSKGAGVPCGNCARCTAESFKL